MRIRTRYVLPLVIAFLSACENANIEQAKAAIESQVLDPTSVTYRNLNDFRTGHVCGELNAKNRLGGYVGYKIFIFDGKDVEFDPSRTDIRNKCSDETPADKLAASGADKNSRTYKKVVFDIKEIALSLSVYRAHNHMYPTTEQTLKALIKKTETAPIPRDFRDGGYLLIDFASIYDPWGRLYQYRSPGTMGKAVDVYTLGSDGVEGGEGEAADIGNWMLDDEPSDFMSIMDQISEEKNK